MIRVALPPGFDLRIAREALDLVRSRAPRPGVRSEILAAMYLVERRWLVETGATMTGDRLMVTPHGLSLQTLASLLDDGWLSSRPLLTHEELSKAQEMNIQVVTSEIPWQRDEWVDEIMSTLPECSSQASGLVEHDEILRDAGWSEDELRENAALAAERLILLKVASAR